MKPEHQTIITVLTQYLEKDPSLRFGQALHGLNINQFQNPKEPHLSGGMLRDIYEDTDEAILKRMGVMDIGQVIETTPGQR
jgi:hypothetical protein